MKKLSLRRETLAELSTEELASVVGAVLPTPPVYFSLPYVGCVLREATITCPEMTPPMTGSCPS